MDADGLRRLTGQTQFDVATLEKDYALNWLIGVIYAPDSPLANVLIFKGGTAIRTVFSPEWRLSEDLDFTILKDVEAKAVQDGFEEIFINAKERSNIQYRFRQFHATDYIILARIQFLGPLNHRNLIKLDISLDEKLVEDPVHVEVEPRYEDIHGFTVLVYGLNEILVEKIRAIMQRGYARDYYDVWRLMRERDFPLDRIREFLIRKCDFADVRHEPGLIFDESRLSEAESHWEDALGRLTPDLPAFELVVGELRDSLKFLQVQS